MKVYRLDGDEVVGTFGPKIRIPLNGGTPRDVVAAHERKSYQTKNEPKIETGEICVGCYYPGIAKPIVNTESSLEIPNSNHELEIARTVWRELQIIAADLEECFNVNTISPANFDSFGAQYEKIIYFACIGVESCFRRALTGGRSTQDRFGMNEYIGLKDVLKVSEYALELIDYPWIPPISPFANWDSDRPSESLDWFAAYNKLKHDKRHNINLATMGNAISAAAAYHLLAYGTIGSKLFPGYLSAHVYFKTTTPNWSYTDVYYPNSENVWTAVDLTP